MAMMPTLFNDCCVAKSKYTDPIRGPQPEPVPGYFGGTAVTPFDSDTQNGDTVGYDITDEPEMEPVVEAYVREMARTYGNDKRILIWNVWNEAGNSQRMEKSVPLMKKVFGWMREEDVMQPLTADVWGAGADHPYRLAEKSQASTQKWNAWQSSSLTLFPSTSTAITLMQECTSTA